MDSVAYNDAETAIDQLCQIARCDYETRASLEAAFFRTANVVYRAEQARKKAK